MKWIPDRAKSTDCANRSFRVISSERTPATIRSISAEASAEAEDTFGFNEFEGNYNLFARLAPGTVRALYKEALQKQHPPSASLNSDEDSWTEKKWTIHSVRRSGLCLSGIEFLPLAVTSTNVNDKETETIYVSYNGGDLASDVFGSDNLIDLPACLEIPSKNIVTVRVLTEVKDAEYILIEPVAVEDWELLELNADWLEGGGLLRQICVVHPNQVIPLWVSGKDVAHVRILSSNFDQTTTIKWDNVWPAKEDYCTDGDEDVGLEPTMCLRLVADTQVIVIPKARESSNSTMCSPLLRLMPAREDHISNDAMLQLERLLRHRLKSVSVCPCTVVVNPETILRLPGYDAASCSGNTSLCRITFSCSSAHLQIPDQPSISAIARIVTSTDVQRNHISLHPLVRLKIKANLYSDYVTAHIVTSSEAKELSNLIPNLLHTGEARLCLQSVEITLKAEQSLKAWRYPEKVSLESELGSYGLADHYRDNELDRFGTAPFMADLPIDLDGFVCSRWLDEIQEHAILYRLSLEFKKPNRSKVMSEAFISIQDLRNYLALTNPSNFVIHRKDVYNQCVVSSSLLVNTLHPTAQFTSFFMSLVEMLSFSSVLVCGEKGSGKSTTALLISSCYHLMTGSYAIYLDCKKLKSARGMRMNMILDELYDAFNSSIEGVPYVVLLDDLDELIPSFDEHSSSNDVGQMLQKSPASLDQSKIIIDVIRHFFRLIKRETSVIATCRRSACLPSHLITAGCFETIYNIPQLSQLDRDKIFTGLLIDQVAGRNRDLCRSMDFGIKTHGFRPRDIEQLVSRFLMRLATSKHRSSSDMHRLVSEELKHFVPLVRLGVFTDRKQVGYGWSDIGGLFKAKSELTSVMLLPSRYRQIFSNAEIRLPRGILLYGLPGTGKSLIPAALATECGYQLVTCRGPELLDKYIGASEAKVRFLFARAAAAAPAVIFLDELDSLAPRRGTDNTGVTDRIVNQLLTFLDGVEDTAVTGSVYVMAATSRPDKVDPALLRPGRLEKHIHVGYPETNEEWSDLLSKISLNYNVESSTFQAIKSGSLVRQLENQSSFCHRLSGADAKAVFNNARLAAVHEALALNLTKEHVEIKSSHLVNAFSLAKPSLSDSDFLQLQSIYSLFNKSEAVGAVATGSCPSFEEKSLRIALR